MLEGMRNPANGKIYEQAGKIPAPAFAKLIKSNDAREIERVQYAFMAWISDQTAHCGTMRKAWARFDRERRMCWK